MHPGLRKFCRLHDGTGTKAGQASLESLTGCAGFAPGLNFRDRGPISRGNACVRASCLHDLDGETRPGMIRDGVCRNCSQDIGGGRQFGIGASLQLGEQAHDCFDPERVPGEINTPWQWNPGVCHNL